MDLNSLILWTVCLSCTVLLFKATRTPLKDTRGWIFVSVLLLSITGVTFVIAPAWTGIISGTLWLILILLPLIGLTTVSKLSYQERYGKARKLAEIVRWLHPTDGWLEQPQLLHALELSQQGKIAAAMEILNRYPSNTPIGRAAMILIYRMGAKWQELLIWIEYNTPETSLLQDSSLAVSYLRALGETGNLNQLLHELNRLQSGFEKRSDLANLNLVRMFALAFCGQSEPLNLMFDGPLKRYQYSPTIRQFWLATAEMAAGDPNARQRFLELQEQSDDSVRNAINWRLSHPCRNPDTILTESSWQILSEIRLQLRQEARYGESIVTGKKTYITYGIIGLNVLVFGLELISGGSENLETLYHLGALVPVIVWQGEWWRLLASTFLHFGILHLSMNMLGLYILGRFVEIKLGMGKYLIAYFVSGIGSMLTITLLDRNLEEPMTFVVGASGAIMGMIGVIAAILLQGWLREKAGVAAKRLRMVLLIIGLQVVFDLTTPQVSFLGHASGTLIGFLVGNLLLIHSTQFLDQE